MPIRDPSDRHQAVALLAALFVVVPVVATGVTAAAAHSTGPPDLAPDPRSPATAVQPEGCDLDDESGHLGYLEREYDYTAGLANDTAGDWTGGEVLPIGANGDCSLAVTNGSATLTAADLDGNRGVLRATVDVGEGGAIRAVTRNDTGAPAASVTVANVGRENDATVAVVTRAANATDVTRTELTAPSGRFFDLTMRFEPNGTVRVAIREADARTPPDEWDATVATGTTDATWTAQLRSRAYLDEIAVGTWEPPTPTSTPTMTPEDDGSEFDFPTSDDDSEREDPPAGGTDDGDSTPGLIMGPIFALGGAGMYRYAYEITRFQEQIDAIGSTTRSSEVEPADWNVALTKGIGVLFAAIGVVWLLTALSSALG
jgi:hypothetical protein